MLDFCIYIYVISITGRKHAKSLLNIPRISFNDKKIFAIDRRNLK